MKKTDTIQNFCMRIKRGCKKFRKILEPTAVEIVSANILRYGEITETIVNSDESTRLNSLWGKNFLDNSTRTFLFKFYNNLLGTNSRVSHFVENHNRSCTFCELSRVQEENLETISHLFFDCHLTETCITNFYTWIFGTDRPRFVNRREFFAGFNLGCSHKNKILDIVGALFKKFIWDCKLRFNIPNSNDANNFFISEFNCIVRVNRSIRESAIKSGILNHIVEIRF